MSTRVTKLGVEVLAKKIPLVVPDPAANTVFPLALENNWRTEFIDEVIWKTEISASKTTGREQRTSELSRPRRRFGALISGMDQSQSTRIYAGTNSISSFITPLPIYSDYTELLADGVNDLVCDTAYRRFFVGQRIAVVPQGYVMAEDGFSNPYQCQFGLIDSLSPTSITLFLDLPIPAKAGDIILPLIDAQISLQSDLDILTNGILEWSQEYTEISSQASLPADTSESVSYYRGLPIFGWEFNWRDNVQVSIVRDGEVLPLGNTDVVSTDGPRAKIRFSGTLEVYDRKTIWNMSRFFDARKGRTNAFWAYLPLTLATTDRPTASQESSPPPKIAVLTSTEIRIPSKTYPTQLLELAEYIMVREINETVSIHKVLDIEYLSLQYTVITIEEIVDVEIQIDSIAIAFISRFDQDNLRKSWLSDGIASFPLSFISTQDEA